MNNYAVFLDRDGVITENNQSMLDGPFYVTSPNQLKYREGALEAIKILNDAKAYIFIVSNQRWVGLNFIEASPVMAKIHQKFLEDVIEMGGFVTDSRYIFSEGYDKLEAITELGNIYDIDMMHSYFVGDSPADMMAGRLSGCKAVFIRNEYSFYKPDPECDTSLCSLYDAVKYILGEKK